MSNVDLARQMYEAFGRGEIETVLGAFHESIEWRDAEGNPYSPQGDPWIGGEEITQKLFMRLATE